VELGECQTHYQQTGQTLPGTELSRRLTALKQQPETAWLREVDSQALQQTLADLRLAYRNFFANRARFPRFKSRKRDRGHFRIPQRVHVANAKVYIPKVGQVPIRQSQPVDGATKSATFSQDAAGAWHVSLVVEFDTPDTCPAACQSFRRDRNRSRTQGLCPLE
jgi:putative transposase